MKNLSLVFLFLIAIVGCSETKSEKTQESGLIVSADKFGEDWPFTVNNGVLDCVKGSAAIFKANDTSYQLNGVASSLGFKSIDAIWKDNAAIPGTKINIGPMIKLALKQCK